MRRATALSPHRGVHRHISIHALHEESDFERINKTLDDLISIHALHEESDHINTPFQYGWREISIHALHEESDVDAMPHSWADIFQSTLSMRRATYEFIYLRRTDVISIHALHEESDHTCTQHCILQGHFNPRSP